MTDSALAIFRSVPEEEHYKFHFGLGLSIRNNLGLWDTTSSLNRYFDSAGVSHPDAMSSIVITTLWRKVHGMPQGLEQLLNAERIAQRRLDAIQWISDSVCPKDGSSLRIINGIERSLPLSQHKYLIECTAREHRWVYQIGIPFYLPSDSLLAEFESGRWKIPYRGIRPSVGITVPMPDAVVDTGDVD